MWGPSPWEPGQAHSHFSDRHRRSIMTLSIQRPRSPSMETLTSILQYVGEARAEPLVQQEGFTNIRTSIAAAEIKPMKRHED